MLVGQWNQLSKRIGARSIQSYQVLAYSIGEMREIISRVPIQVLEKGIRQSHQTVSL
jgi:hypothetical protein